MNLAGPISFTAPLALAIREGRKTQTRRPVTLRRCCDGDTRLERGVPHNVEQLVEDGEPNVAGVLFGTDPYLKVPYCEECDAAGDRVRAPYRVGQVRWVREPARIVGVDAGSRLVEYVADGARRAAPWPARLKPVRVGACIPNGCHREAARTFVEVAAVRFERLRDITEEDAAREGIFQGSSGYFVAQRGQWLGRKTACAAFAALWNAVYAARGYGWDANPWVWAVSFKLVDEDAARRAA